MSDNRIILHADMDYFFAQCEEREHPGRVLILVKKLQISGYSIIEYGNCRYFEGKRKSC